MSLLNKLSQEEILELLEGASFKSKFKKQEIIDLLMSPYFDSFTPEFKESIWGAVLEFFIEDGKKHIYIKKEDRKVS